MLSFKKSRDKTSQTRHYLLKLKIKDFNVMIVRVVIFFIIFLTNKVICWLQFKQNALNVSLKAMRQINFTENLHWAGNATMFFIIKEAKETLLDFSQRSLKVLYFFFPLIYINTKRLETTM